MGKQTLNLKSDKYIGPYIFYKSNAVSSTFSAFKTLKDTKTFKAYIIKQVIMIRKTFIANIT